ncbi:hypothetical protein EDB89DRAFT_321755 [Lactarius sanguifluus]|nr:hypothetical protein EDB89DRAFT_321755 [Lactarius sanguifluus]
MLCDALIVWPYLLHLTYLALAFWSKAYLPPTYYCTPSFAITVITRPRSGARLHSSTAKHADLGGGWNKLGHILFDCIVFVLSRSSGSEVSSGVIPRTHVCVILQRRLTKRKGIVQGPNHHPVST